MAAYTRLLDKIIPKYACYNICSNRYFLQLIAVHLLYVGQARVGELDVIDVSSSVIPLLLHVHAGYVDDKGGNRNSIIFGAAVATFSPLFYIFMPIFYGGLIASVLFFGGYAFQSGATEAFMHDTLAALKREKEYSKVMGRAQSYGLA